METMEERGPVQPGDVIQCDPKTSRWGPVLVIVEEVRPWGVQGYFMMPARVGGGPTTIEGRAYVRVKSGEFVRIGRATWVAYSVKNEPETEPDDENEVKPYAAMCGGAMMAAAIATAFGMSLEDFLNMCTKMHEVGANASMLPEARPDAKA